MNSHKHTTDNVDGQAAANIDSNKNLYEPPQLKTEQSDTHTLTLNAGSTFNVSSGLGQPTQSSQLSGMLSTSTDIFPNRNVVGDRIEVDSDILTKSSN